MTFHFIMYQISRYLESIYFENQSSIVPILIPYTISGSQSMNFKSCYDPITSLYQQEICDKINIKFLNEIEQHRALVKSPLANYIP